MTAEPVSPITAIIVAYNSASVLSDCLACVRASGLAAIVVDNASSDASARLAREAGADVIANAQNQGFGRAMNQGLARAPSPFCLLINPDIGFAPEAPATLASALEATPRALMAGPRLIEPDGRAFELAPTPINPPLPDGAPPNRRSVLSGAALLVRRQAVLTLGGFDPQIFLFWEDNDLCRRIVDSGGELLYCDQAEMRHARGGSTAPAPGNAYKVRWHQAWSRLYVFEKYGLASDAQRWIGRFARKAALARLMGARKRLERYQGSLDGARAFLRGHTALAQEGLA